MYGDSRVDQTDSWVSVARNKRLRGREESPVNVKLKGGTSGQSAAMPLINASPITGDRRSNYSFFTFPHQ